MQSLTARLASKTRSASLCVTERVKEGTGDCDVLRDADTSVMLMRIFRGIRYSFYAGTPKSDCSRCTSSNPLSSFLHCKDGTRDSQRLLLAHCKQERRHGWHSVTPPLATFKNASRPLKQIRVPQDFTLRPSMQRTGTNVTLVRSFESRCDTSKTISSRSLGGSCYSEACDCERVAEELHGVLTAGDG